MGINREYDCNLVHRCMGRVPVGMSEEQGEVWGFIGEREKLYKMF